MGRVGFRIDKKTIMSQLTVEKFGERLICVKGVGKIFYQEGFPLSLSVYEFHKKGVEVSFLHVVQEFWDNGWSWKTIEMKLKGEIGDDVYGTMKLDMDNLHKFYNYLEQPARSNGGYEQSREMIFQYLFGCSSENVRSGEIKEPIEWLRNQTFNPQ